MNKKLIPFLLITGALVTACNEPTDSSAPAATTTSTAAPAPAADANANVGKDDAVAVVNGVAISKTTFKTLEDEIASRTQGQKFPTKQLLEELIQRELLVQDARKKNLDQSAEIKERMRMAEQSLLSQADLQDYLKANPISDADLKDIYDKEVAAKMSGTEYKARHILVKTEDEAKKIIAELGKGGKFEDLAKKHSLDPSKDQGGDLGWFSPNQMVEPFSKAVEALEKGKYTQAPVQTQFGWHVILREDSRAQTPPAFDAVKEQLRPMVQQQKIQAMLEGLRKDAKVEILISTDEPKAEDKPATDASAPAAGDAAAPAADVSAEKPAEAAAAPATAEAPKAEAAATPEAAAEPAKTEAAATPASASEAAKPAEPAKQ